MTMNKILIQNDTYIEDEIEIKRYQSEVGVCNFFSTTTRYDIAYCMSRLSQFSDKPTLGSRKALDKVMSYLRYNNTFTIKGVFHLS